MCGSRLTLWLQVLDHKVGDGIIRVGTKAGVFPEPFVGVSLRPDDVFAKKLASTGNDTRNVLVRVTVPIRTGRKRKRGSDAPFLPDTDELPQSDSITADDLQRRLRDTEYRYKVEAVGAINETHRFRNLPDFQMRAADTSIMRRISDHILTPSYDKLSTFGMDLKTGPTENADSFSVPPILAPIGQPYVWNYEQAWGVVYAHDDATGEPTSANFTSIPRRTVSSIDPGITVVPAGPPLDIKIRAEGSPSILRAVEEIQEVMKTRPILIRRAALNLLPNITLSTYIQATELVGYSFSKGPFRDCLIRYGIDPRKDPQYRIYQTLTFVVDVHASREGRVSNKWKADNRTSKEEISTTHIFSGDLDTIVTEEGKTWQVCDITDPLLARILSNPDGVRAEFEPTQWGWYQNGTVSKARVIMRDMLRCAGTGMKGNPADYEKIATMAEFISSSRAEEGYIKGEPEGTSLAAMTRDLRTISCATTLGRKVARAAKPERAKPTKPVRKGIKRGPLSRRRVVEEDSDEEDEGAEEWDDGGGDDDDEADAPEEGSTQVDAVDDEDAGENPDEPEADEVDD